MSSSRPVSQESVFRSKLLAQTAEMRNRRNSNTSPPKPQEKTVSEISMKDFMDFLKISYQVNEAIEGAPTDIGDKTNVDWKKLTTNALLTQLKERESLLASSSSTEEKSKPDSPPRGVEKVKCSSLESKRNDSGDNKSSSDSPTKSVSRQSSDEKSFEKRSSFDKSSPSTEKTTASSSSSSLDKRFLPDRERRPSIGRRKGSFTSKKDGNNENETSRSLDGTGQGRTAEKLLKKKLNEVLQEGILDSVLPYLLPKQQQSGSQPPIKKLLASSELRKIAGMDRGEKSNTPAVVTKDKKESRRKSTTSSETANKGDKKDVEVVIHVCDEIKNLKKDFRCSQKLLVSQMGYFAEVTTGQKLEDMDISVHCDVTIFDWLMRWVKKESTSEESWPSLDSAIVIPVLMSSAFLQMDTLQEHCLQFCRNHINEIIRDSSNLGCINDSILTRLANLFSNTEIESMKDRKDKLQSKLYCKLVVSLTDPQPQPQRGHYSSIATMYRCSKCSKLILRSMSSSIRCVPSNMIMDRNGCINSTHVRDPSWNLTEYVKDLKNELKVWRKVYWRLWSDCHLLHCTSCCSYFPLHQISWCRYHAEPAQFFSMENQRSMSFPIGRYPCCGERAYRFEILQNNAGCQYRDHVTDPKNPTELEIYRIWNDHKELIKADPPPLVPPERMRLVSSSREESGDKKSPCKDPLWWDGLELIPTKPKLGLLAKIWDHVMKKEDPKRVGSDHRGHRSPVRKHVTVSQPSTQEGSSFSDSSDQESSSSEAGDSEESCHATVRVTAKPKGSVPSSHYITATSKAPVALKKQKKKRKKRKVPDSACRNEGSRFWVSKLSTRCNQDNQREFEERAIRQIEAILARKTSGESLRGSGSRSHYHAMPPGGTYVRLEQEWREAHCSSHGCPGSSVKAKGSSSYLNVNNSTFTMLSKSKGRGQR